MEVSTMKVLSTITNGIIIAAIGFIHVACTFLPRLYGRQFAHFSEFYFFKIGMDHESFAAFWFFYFGLALILIGLLAHLLERETGALKQSFIIPYSVFVVIGCYMIPYSGMTYFMLPHALYMLIRSRMDARRRAG
jgi:hypothetical protein